MREPLRMQAVQSPIIPVVAEWIRNCPGTISLGQGVVNYGPPPAALEQISRFLADPQNPKYQPVHGLPILLEALAAKLKSENGILTSAPNQIVDTADPNITFMNAVLTTSDPG